MITIGLRVEDPTPSRSLDVDRNSELESLHKERSALRF